MSGRLKDFCIHYNRTRDECHKPGTRSNVVSCETKSFNGSICEHWKCNMVRGAEEIQKKKPSWFELEQAQWSKHHYKDSKGVTF